MKRLAVCAVIALAIAVIVAHYWSGVARLSASELAERSASALAAKICDQILKHGVAVPPERIAIAPLAWFLRPGAYLISRIGLDPAKDAGLVISFIFGWWCWLTFARLICTIIGRAFGLTNAGMFHWWLAIAVPWRPVYRTVLRLQMWLKQFRYGSRATAAWTGLLAEMTLTYEPGDSIYLGRIWAFGLHLFQPIGIRGSRHVVVVAASGAGKTRWLMAWLGMLHKAASAFVIDVDGQIVNALGWALRRKGHKIYNLDPYRLTKFPGACWNALDDLTRAAARHGREAVVRYGLTLAEALVQESNKHQPIFSDSARVGIHGLILYVWLFEPEERRNLVCVRELLTRGLPELVIDPKQDAFEVVLSVMDQAISFDDGCGGAIVSVIARAASVFRSGKTREGNPFRSTAIAATSWLDIPEIAAISRHSDFACEDLKTSNPCVFICAPVTDIQTKLAGWVRALTMMSLYTFQNIPGSLKIPCTFAIDEAPSLGRLEILESAAAVFRKFGARIVVITQDLERLRQAYPDSWGGFIGNAECTLWMSTEHLETKEILSKTLGMTTYIEELRSGLFSKVPSRLERRERPLMAPDQVPEFLGPQRKQFIVTRAGRPPLRVAFEGYDHALAVWDYERDLNFREPLLRALTRLVHKWLRRRN